MPPEPSPANSITSGEVARLAVLARLALTEEETATLAGQLGVIVGAVSAVAEVSSAEVPPTSHPLPLTNVTRPDVIRPSLPREDVLAGAPAAEGGRFRVPRILDDEQ